MTRVPLLATAELRAVESAHADAKPPLMARAGAAVARAARHMAADGPVLLVAGPGNNGGDAWVAARELRAAGRDITVLDTAGTQPRATEAARAFDALQSAGIPIVREWPSRRFALVVDGLLGIGLARDVEGAVAAAIERIHACGLPILAIDVPSGLDADTGQVRGRAVRAARTITFIAHKPGLWTLDGPDHAGEVLLDDLGLGDETRAAGKGTLLEPSFVRGWLSRRPRNAHKGLYGTLGIVGGSPGMVGAALLAGRTAVLCGAGKTRVALIDAALAVDPQMPEMMISDPDAALQGDVVVIGPGGGTRLEMLARAIAIDKPLVVDADALNAVARDSALAKAIAGRRAGTIMTPHPGEASRLLGRPTAEVQADRRATALELASRFNAHVVLKGAGSACAAPSGEWSINTTGNAGLASGGSGDVLAGMVGALLAQRLDPWRALQYAVCLHGAAADALVARGAGPIGLTASEVALEARRLLNAWTAPA